MDFWRVDMRTSITISSTFSSLRFQLPAEISSLMQHGGKADATLRGNSLSRISLFLSRYWTSQFIWTSIVPLLVTKNKQRLRKRKTCHRAQFFPINDGESQGWCNFVWNQYLKLTMKLFWTGVVNVYVAFSKAATFTSDVSLKPNKSHSSAKAVSVVIQFE